MLNKSHPAVVALVEAFSEDGSWEAFQREFQDLALFVAPLASTLPSDFSYVCNPEETEEGWTQVWSHNLSWSHPNGYGDAYYICDGDRIGLGGCSAGSEGASALNFSITPV